MGSRDIIVHEPEGYDKEIRIYLKDSVINLEAGLMRINSSIEDSTKSLLSDLVTLTQSFNYSSLLVWLSELIENEKILNTKYMEITNNPFISSILLFSEVINDIHTSFKHAKGNGDELTSRILLDKIQELKYLLNVSLSLENEDVEDYKTTVTTLYHFMSFFEAIFKKKIKSLPARTGSK